MDCARINKRIGTTKEKIETNMIYNQDIKAIPFIPQKITSAAMLTYLAALVACLVVYQTYALEWKWILFAE